MTYFFRFVKSDFVKIKRQPLLIMHTLIPLLGIIIFLSYFSYTPWKPTSKVFVFLQMAAFVFPILIALICSMVVDQEALAGNFQQMLTSDIKLMPFLSKLTVVLLFGLSSMLVLVCGFGAGFSYILNESPFEFRYYMYAGCILFFSSIFIYVFHIIISMKFGNIPSIGIGITESLLSIIFATDLGLGKWEFVPCTWGMRLMMYFHKFTLKDQSFFEEISELRLGIILCILGTIIITIFACLWFFRWEGRKSE
ncbi:lantibiotic immunity ABC transporter MutG family permease subunit [Clostridium uliginosum]|uniref:ABC-2 type transport system permease protein n=1 Tax=Clostridium uliginosum TaxID=119641 RepID=A0A1I1R2G5_9CLOT|nr:lantibiotic immunity ABC transporter MutG family permease subunit [Clostridium uliginosum]SFD28505.1 ABC-2 type transport system permease protein [Clostridium uliginosum]